MIRIFVIIGVAGLILSGLIPQCSSAGPATPPPRPANLPSNAVWAGGLDGGAWFVISQQQPRPDVWSIKVYNDNGSPWARGDFWAKDAKGIHSPLSISYFDGRIIRLEGNIALLPVGEHFYPQAGSATTVIAYPSPNAGYTNPTQLAERSTKEETW